MNHAGNAITCKLENRGAIRVSGEDRRTFLQGLISNDINICKPGHPIYAAFLTPQGKFLHDLFVIDDGDFFLIDCEAARADDLLKRLTAHKLRAKIALEKTGLESWAAFGIDKTPAGFYADPRLSALGFRALLKKDTEPSAASPFAAYDAHRIGLGVADGSRDLIVEKSTLAEGNFDFLNGISWSKGCYMGQELTARMHYRALVKKRLFPVTITGPAPAPGTIIQGNGAEAGEMRTSAGAYGLALLSIDMVLAAMRDDQPLTCGTSRLTPVKPEWMKLEKEKED